MALFGKKRETDDSERENEEETKTSYDHLYDGGSHRKPAGCRACGGPYPMCKDGCSLFDNDD